MTLAERIAARIHREGPIPFDSYVEAALYDPEGGFFATGHGAGRAGRDFVTSPQVGSLFGELMAQALDGWWHELGEPDPFVVVEAGAGNGQLGRDVLRANPACGPALRYVLVERSDVLRAEQVARLEPAAHLEPAEAVLGPVVFTGDPDDPVVIEPGRGPLVCSLAELPAVGLKNAVLIANELLDNLVFRIVERQSDGWAEVRVGAMDARFREVLVPADPALVAHLPIPEVGMRLPVLTGVDAWLAAAAACLRSGRLVCIDYGASALELATRSWLRTYSAHARGDDPFSAPGTCDITIDVPTDVVAQFATHHGFALTGDVAQRDWLHDLGLEERVATARTAWDAGRARGDLAAVRARSTVHEADALTDPAGLGAHRVLAFTRG